ncbi:MAG TPA: LLM class flavin-dependent oxidoreductase [Micromonosporaceae bacterium]|nr:LLM class flavin-dependent oxidoreductase [Micromonosporaceae bacterium]
MGHVTIIGAVFLPYVEPELLPRVARAADDAGLEELWLWEDCFRTGGVATTAVALAVTERLRVGVGIYPVPLRNVAISAMEIGTLERLYPGRQVVGVGHGVQEWMGQVGARAASPVTLLREYATALRALLAGAEVSTAGRYVSLDKVQLGWPPASPPGVHVGAIGPRTLRLAGEFGDGTVLTGGTTADEVRAARATIDEGRAAGGRTDPHRITVFLAAATGPGAEERLRADGARYGFDGSGPYGVAGGAEAIAAEARRLADAGADAVIVQPTADDPDPAGFVRFLAEEVTPLVG